MHRKFKLPLSNEDIAAISHLKKTFCVIGVFSAFSSGASIVPSLKKEHFVAQLLSQVSIKPADESERNNGGNIAENVTSIEMNINERSGVVVLEVKSLDTVATLTAALTNMTTMKSEEMNHAKCVLFLLHACQFVILVQQSTNLSTRIIRLLRLLDTLRQNVTPSLMSFVSHKFRTGSVPNASQVPDVWMRLGARFCTPRFILCCLCPSDFFYSFNCQDGMAVEQHLSEKETKEKTIAAFKKYCSVFEEEVYHILSKSWIVHEHGSLNGLVAVPPKKPFVYIIQLKNANNPTSFLLDRLTSVASNKKVQVDKYQFDGTDGLQQLWADHIDWVLKSSKTTEKLKHPFTDPIFDFPKLDLWFSCINLMYQFIFTDATYAKHFEPLRGVLDTEAKFSDHRCAKALPLAFRVYQDQLPNQYTSEKHWLHVQNAVAYFSNSARGTSFDKYLKELKEKCQAYWENGRQLCEVQSLTNHHCVYAFHFLTDVEKSASVKPSKGVPIKPHNSKIRSSSACNCGRRVANRDDPFTLIDANITFYADMEVRCCNRYDHINFPIRSDDRNLNLEYPEPTAALDSSNKFSDLVVDVRTIEGSQNQSTQGNDLTLDVLSLNDLGQTNDNQPPIAVNSKSKTKLVEPLEAKKLNPKLKKISLDLPMLSYECPPSFLPKVEMWCLLKFDEYSSYDSSNGLDLPGFIHGTNFLLPFDVNIVHTVDEAWPKLNANSDDNRAKRPMSRPKPSQNGAQSSMITGSKTSRAYIGYEYECFKGTRLFLANRDTLVKGTPTGPDVALNAIKNNMPLYYSCSCRVSKNPHFAQLMRIHLVAPPNTQLKLNPVVRPLGMTEPTLGFFPQWESIAIPQGHWVLRLPFIYWYSKGNIPPPRDHAVANLGYIEGGIVSGASFINS